ncbi:MAG: oleate hydratase [Pilosibacter sp.]
MHRQGDAEVRQAAACWSLSGKISRPQDPAFGHPEKFCSDIEKTNWESATVTTSNEEIIFHIKKICKRDPRTGKVVTGGIVSCRDSSWLLSWTINRQGQFKEQKKDEVCVWVYSLFTDVPGDLCPKKPMRECTGKEITAEWLYHLGHPGRGNRPWPGEACMQTVHLTMMPYITAFFMPRRAGDRPDVIPDGMCERSFLRTVRRDTAEIRFSPPNILSARPWKLSTAFAAWIAVCRRYGAAFTM